ncbi:MAG: hypothetical protein ACREXR_00365 [Gammaproteobacteria bacterium]
MRTTTQVVAAAAVSAYPWVSVDHHVENFNVAYHIMVNGTGDFTATLQRTLTNLDPASGGVAVSAFPIAMHSFVAATAAALIIPSVALRLNVTAISGAAGYTFEMLQAGN